MRCSSSSLQLAACMTKSCELRPLHVLQLLQVAIDVADALRYLHHHSYPQILHR